LTPHPAALIVLWVNLTFIMQTFQMPALLVTAAVLLAVACGLDAGRLLMLLRRTPWIMLSLLLIYGYATPGAGIWGELGIYSPTWDGLGNGLVQLGRLMGSLAGLCILLSLLPQHKLLGGLYTLTYSLGYLGVSREPVAVRLALTLLYAENALRATTAGWRTPVEKMLVAPETEQTGIEVHAGVFAVRDGALVASSLLLLIL
jgi:hypothetical protein